MIIALLAAALAGFTAAPQQHPNVILIMTDDQGWGDLGVNGNPLLATPNLDRLAAQSARVEPFYVSPVCAPTRACLLTGRYNYRTRVIDTYLGRAMMDPGEVTLAEILAGAGYATGIFGKWHLGDCYPMRAMDQGFEESLVHRGGGIGQPSDPPGGEGRYSDPILFHNGERYAARGYCTEVFFEAAQHWIEGCVAAERPFLCYLPTNCPHAPYGDVPRELYEKYRAMDLSNARFPRVPGHPLPSGANLEQRARIFAMIEDIDRNIGRLLAKIDELGIGGRTIVIFLCDNGPQQRRFLGGMAGRKGDVHEGGIRTPFFARWPGHLPAGRLVRTPGAHIDVLPTLLEACGVAPPAGLRLDGRSLLALLAGREAPWSERTIFIQSHRGDTPVRYHNFAAIGAHWKLVHASGFGPEHMPAGIPFELYDRLADPLETRDLAAEQPAVVAELKRRYDAWFDDVSTTRSHNYARPRIFVGTPHENPVVLTRQDWIRDSAGGGWGRDSIGHWLLHAPARCRLDLLARFAKLPAAGRLRIALGKRTWLHELPAGATTCTVADLLFERGDARLDAVLEWGRKRRGILQAELRRRR